MPFNHPDFDGVKATVLRETAPCARPAARHPDDVAVDALAALMKGKLAKQRAKGYGGWDTDCTQQRLSDLLRGHVDKGDPVDVANFCAFLVARGEGIAAASRAAQANEKSQTAPCVTPADVEAAIASEHYYTGQIAAEAEDQHRALGGILNCTLVMKNGQLVNGEALLQDLNKPDPERAKVSARRRAFDKAYDMVVYAERDRLAATPAATTQAADAERYRFLRLMMQFEKSGKTGKTVMAFTAPMSADATHNIHKDWMASKFDASVDRTVDAAIAAQAGKGE